MVDEWGAYPAIHARELHTTVEELLREVPLHPIFRESGTIVLILVKLLKVVSHLDLVERFTVSINSQDSLGQPVNHVHQKLQTMTLHPNRGFMKTWWMNREDFVTILEDDFTELRDRVAVEIEK